MQPMKPYHEKRPWGEFIEFTRNSPSTVKILTVKAGEAFSLQTHNDRDEFWKVLSGHGNIIIGSETYKASPDQEFFVKRNTKHRIEAVTDDVKVLEISFGEFRDEDIVRLEDRYNRQ